MKIIKQFKTFLTSITAPVFINKSNLVEKWSLNGNQTEINIAIEKFQLIKVRTRKNVVVEVFKYYSDEFLDYCDQHNIECKSVL